MIRLHRITIITAAIPMQKTAGRTKSTDQPLQPVSTSSKITNAPAQTTYIKIFPPAFPPVRSTCGTEIHA